MTPGRFRVLRSFWLNGETMGVGHEFHLADAAVIEDLLAAGKAEPADEQTRRRVVTRKVVSWEPVRVPDPT